MLARIHIYLNLHFLEVNRDKNCTDSVEHPRKQGSNHESKAKQQSNCCERLGSPGRKRAPLRGESGRDLHLSHFQHEVLIIQQWKLCFVHRLARQLFGILISSLLSRWLLYYTLYLEPRFIQFLSMHRSLLKLIFSLRTSSFCFFTHTLHKRNGSSKLMFFVIIIALHLLATFHTMCKALFH